MRDRRAVSFLGLQCHAQNTIIVLMSLAAAPAPIRAASPASIDITSGAYRLINERISDVQSHFFVYQDADSGLNHGFPSGVFGLNDAVRKKLHLDAGCVYSPVAASGCATDPTTFDRTRGTVFRLSFDPLAIGEYVGVNFEEPEHWGATGGGNGYDLTGATQVVFDAISVSGPIKVQFGVAGGTTDYMSIPPQWTTITVSLSSLGLPAGALSNAHVLFGVATKDQYDTGGGTILLDNIRFLPVPARQQSALGFPVSNQTFGILHVQDVLSGSIPIPPDQANSNVATIYESSLTVLALLRRAQPNDLANAKLLADSLVYALGHDNQGDSVPLASDGSGGLHNAMSSGDLALSNSQGQTAGQAGQVRLAGFSASVLCGQTGFCPILDGASAGNNAFAILALLAAYRQFQNPVYLSAATTTADWIYLNLLDTSNTGYGGYYAGYPDGSSTKPLETGKSTADNAAVFVAFSALANAQQTSGNTSAAGTWLTRANIAGDFVMGMFDQTTGHFFAGTVPSTQQQAPGIFPTGNRRGMDVINIFDFSDSQTLPVLTMSGISRYASQIDWHLPIHWLLQHSAQSVSANGITFQGLDLIEPGERRPTDGPSGIAWEFTAQGVVAMQFADQILGTSQFASTSTSLINQLSLAQASAPFGDGQGLVAATLQNGDVLPPYQQCLVTPFQCVAERVGLAATAWAIFAEQGFNPFSNGGAPAVPTLTGNAVNAASFTAPVTPGSIASIFGTNLFSTGVVNVQLSGVTSYTLADAPGQINFQVPWELAGQAQASLTVTSGGIRSDALTVALAPVNPGIFSLGAGAQGAIVISISGELAAPSDVIPGLPSRPVQHGEFISIYCTGLGPVTNTPASGLASPSNPLAQTTAAPAVTIGGIPALATDGFFSGLAPGAIGLYQVNVQVPQGVPAGSTVSLSISMGNAKSNTVTIAIQ